MPSVAAVIIGDEILSGKFADENGPYLVRRLRELGADLVRLATIGDRVDDIAEEVRRCAASCDAVITTGGVGPTHDDRTLEGVARAFDLPLEQHPELVALLESFGLELNAAALRMATVPAGAELLAGSDRDYPVLRVRNTYVFPGVPRLMQRKFERVAHHFSGRPVHVARVHTRARETAIAAQLGEVQRAFPDVAIGSYPRHGDGGYRVIVTLEGRDPERLALAREAVRRRLPGDD